MSIYDNLNLGNSIFQGFNDKFGLMICGYEYGYSKKDENYQTDELLKNRENAIFTFANKEVFLGEYFWTIPYDNRIAKWFELWGYSLDRVGLGGDFEKSIIQTNWSNSQNNNMGGKYNWLLDEENIDNFIGQIELLKPSIVLFMGSRLINFLNNEKVLSRFENIVGKTIDNRKFIQKDSSSIRFKVHFQTFERCQVVCFPHPSASRGLSLEYIAQFKPEMNKILQEYKQKRGF